MHKLTKEIFLWVFILLPYLVLWKLWHQLPETVATHFNFKGEADDWSSRSSLIYIPCLIPLGIYLLLLIVPAIDPKKKLQQMGDKFYMIRLITVVFMSALSIYILFASKTGSMTGPNMLLAIIGAFFAGLGNYMPAMRPNYFVGIRTPWTLENEEVWKKTHRLGGKFWMAGGLLIVVLSLLIQNTLAISIAFGTLLLVMTLVPVVYSYIEFKRMKTKESES